MIPALFIVPGSYEGPAPFTPLKNLLASQTQTKVHVTHLPSTGTSTSPDGSCIDMNDDTLFIAADLRTFVDECGDREVLIFGHSAGGFLGSSAVKGLTKSDRVRNGQPGGVVGMVFLTAGLLPEGIKHRSLPFMLFSDDGRRHTCAEPDQMLFNDATQDQKDTWIERMQCQPGEEWHQTIEYCGWRDLPSVYIVCEDDRATPLDVQHSMAEMAGCLVVVLKGAGHMAQITRTEEVASIVVEEMKKYEM